MAKLTPMSSRRSKTRPLQGKSQHTGRAESEGGRLLPRNALGYKLPKKRPSLLERKLPLEVLERIFILSANVNLPKSSPLLGLFLSNRSTLVQITIAAFHETWDYNFGLTMEEAGHWEEVDEEKILERMSAVGGNLQFQNGILASPWLTVDILLEAQDLWYQKCGEGRLFKHVPMYCRQIYPFLDDTLDFGHHLSDGPAHRFQAKECFEHDYAMAKQLLIFQNQGDSECHHTKSPITWNHGIAWMRADVHPRITVPTGLLRGPWTEREEKLLFWLVRAGAVEIYNKDNWETILKGFHTALLGLPKVNMLVLNLFLLTWSARLWDVPTRRQAAGQTQTAYEDHPERFDGVNVKQLIHILQHG